jgi:RNA-directed DNA polymerase
VIIPKRNGKQRELKIPTVRDRIVQQALLNILYPLMEQKFSTASFAYRPNLSYLNAVETVAQWRDQGYQWVLDGDIVKFFDTIDHQRLLQQVRFHINHSGILCLIKSWLSAGVLTEAGVMVSQKGIPQGAVISPILANIYLHEFDEWVTATDLRLVRYADDFLVLAQTQARILEAKLEVINLLEPMGLRLHPEKTQVTNFERGFRFLGHGFLENAIFPVDANDVSLGAALRKIKGIIVEKTNGKHKRKKKEENPNAVTSPPSPLLQGTTVLGNVENLSPNLSPTRREALNSPPWNKKRSNIWSPPCNRSEASLPAFLTN